MSEAYKEGKDAYYRGMEKNRNPFINQPGLMNELKRKAWDTGFDKAMIEARGV